MLFPLKNLALFAGAFLLLAGAAKAQVTAVEGVVTGAEGPIKGAVVKFDRTDMKGHYEVKTDKKGHYGHYGLPIGTYSITVEVDGAKRDQLNKVSDASRRPDGTELRLEEERRAE